MIDIKCDMCGKELCLLGALVFSPPEGGTVQKWHLCGACFWKVKEFIFGKQNTKGKKV